MNKVKKIFRENAFIILLGVIIISIFLVQFISKTIENSKKYSSDLMNNGEIYYIEHKYEDNEYKVINMDEFDIINYYYRDFIKKLVNNPEEAWELLDDNNKSEVFGTDIDAFMTKVKQIVTVKTKNNKIEKYKKQNGKYTIVDTEDHMYVIEDNGVWNYKVSYLGQSKSN